MRKTGDNVTFKSRDGNVENGQIIKVDQFHFLSYLVKTDSSIFWITESQIMKYGSSNTQIPQHQRIDVESIELRSQLLETGTEVEILNGTWHDLGGKTGKITGKCEVLNGNYLVKINGGSQMSFDKKDFRIIVEKSGCKHIWEITGSSPITNETWENCKSCGIGKEKC